MIPSTHNAVGIVLQAGLQNTVQQIVSNVLSFIPTIIAAIIILIIGWIIGAIIGGIVSRVIQGIGGAVPLDEEDVDSLASALGKLLKYFIIYLAFLAAADTLGIQILTQLLSDIGGYLPVILGAAVILAIGFIIGRVLEDIIADIVGGFGLDSALQGTPLEALTDERGLGGLVGKVVALYVYFLTVLAAADTLSIPIISQFLSRITAYIPQLIGGLVVLLVGIWVGDWVGGIIADSDSKRLTDYFGVGVKIFIYYLSVTIALQTAGFDASILSTFFMIVVSAFAGALAIAFIIAVGVGGALGSKDYIADNIADWVEGAQESVSIEEEAGGTSESEDVVEDIDEESDSDFSTDTDFEPRDEDDTDFDSPSGS
jgi:MFS family permease